MSPGAGPKWYSKSHGGKRALTTRISSSIRKFRPRIGNETVFYFASAASSVLRDSVQSHRFRQEFRVLLRGQSDLDGLRSRAGIVEADGNITWIGADESQLFREDFHHVHHIQELIAIWLARHASRGDDMGESTVFLADRVVDLDIPPESCRDAIFVNWRLSL